LVADHRAELAEQALQEMVAEAKLCKAGLHTLQTSFNNLKTEYERMSSEHKATQRELEVAQTKETTAMEDEDEKAETPKKQPQPPDLKNENEKVCVLIYQRTFPQMNTFSTSF
jgi:hypothetical protein